MTWTCAECECWLDEGCPDRDKDAAEAHARRCTCCSAALAAARFVEEALALPLTAAAPAGFSDAVMRRVSLVDTVARARILVGPPLPWWVRAATSPLTVTLSALAALLSWRSPALWAGAARLAPRLAVWGDRAQRWLATAIEIPVVRSVFAEPAVLLGLAIAVAAPLLLWVGWELARWSERAVARRAVRLAYRP